MVSKIRVFYDNLSINLVEENLMDKLANLFD